MNPLAKHLFAFAAVSLIALVGCNKNKKPAVASKDANPKITEVAPPAPVHQPVVQQQPIVVQPVTTVTPVVDTPEPVVSKPVKDATGPVAGKSYTVQKGDTLWSIAHKTYGDGKQYKKIVAANPSIKGDKVAAGQKITLP